MDVILIASFSSLLYLPVNRGDLSLPIFFKPGFACGHIASLRDFNDFVCNHDNFRMPIEDRAFRTDKYS